MIDRRLTEENQHNKPINGDDSVRASNGSVPGVQAEPVASEPWMADQNDTKASTNGNTPDARGAGGQPVGAERMAERALESANRAAQSIASATGASATPVDLPNFSPANGSPKDPSALAMLDDVLLHVKVELGRTRMYVEDVLRLSADSVVELDKAAGDPVDIYVNDRHVARGEVLVVNENFCVRVSEILAPVAPE